VDVQRLLPSNGNDLTKIRPRTSSWTHTDHAQPRHSEGGRLHLVVGSLSPLALTTCSEFAPRYQNEHCRN
jgi:hypothetical protein